jgi:hypothetical protein
MTKSLNIGDFVKLAQNLLNEQQNGQEFMLLDVYKQTREAYERFPEDPVIRQVAFVVEKMTEKAKSGTIINQAQVSKIHNEFARLSENSKFKMVLGHLLINTNASTPNGQDFVRLNRLDAENSSINFEDLVDQNLVGNFDVALNGNGTIKPFDQKTAEKGAEYVKVELVSLGFNNPRVKILGGNEDTLIYTASFDTEKGLVDVKIPIDLHNKQLIFPSTFIAEDRIESLTAANINNFVNKVAQERNPNINNRAGNLHSDIAFDTDIQIAGTEQKVEMPKELVHLSRDFDDSILEAASAFGKNIINKGKQVVIRELVAAGFKNAQVKFGSENTDSVIYLASINTPKGAVEIEVPVEMKVVSNTYVPLLPTYFAYDGLVEDFTAAKLQRFAISLPAPSTKNVVCSSAYNYMLLPELKDEILKAASENDYPTCETILQYIEDKFSEEDHRNSIADYQYLLMTKTKIASKEQHVCRRMIPAGKTSIYDYCGCYNVPMNKVVADDHGNCILKSAVERQKLNPLDQSGVLISNSKINFT